MPKKSISDEHTRNVELLLKAIEPQRPGYREVIERHMQQDVRRLFELLAKHNGDAHAAAPFPYSNCGKFAYMAAKKLHDDMRYWTKQASDHYVSRGMNDPDPRIPLSGKIVTERIFKAADEMTKYDFANYAHKLAGKIAKPVSSAKVEGVLWLRSTLVAEIDEPFRSETFEVQRWETKMILNVSCLGKLFNQWPTRKL